MKRFVLAGVAIATLMGAANAADVNRRAPMPTKAVPYTQLYNWTGGYVGINGGYGWGTSNFSAPATSGDFDTSGAMVGGTVGYNWQAGQTVFGLEGDIDWSNIRGSSACGVGLTCETRNNWMGTARGRIGYAFDRFMPYVTGGLAVGGVKNSIAGFGETTSTKAGYALGGGLEAALAGPWTAKVEYLYADLGRTSAPLGSDARFKTNTVRAGVNYRF
ncbi:MAG: porin family protein [Pseudolabrys sp.]|nr:porin family protein [Pseudolabrys sp.]MDP2297235.1 porin family protein [Pseudolabrys sp.]